MLSTPTLASEYESLWYRWTSFQDTKDDQNLYVQCGFINEDDTMISIYDFKITKKGSNEYELYQIVGNDWTKQDADFDALSSTFELEEGVSLWNIPRLNNINWRSASQLDEVFTYQLKQFYTPNIYDLAPKVYGDGDVGDEADLLLRAEKQTEYSGLTKHQSESRDLLFYKYLQITNTMKILGTLSFHSNSFSKRLDRHPPENTNLNQFLSFKVRKNIGNKTAGDIWTTKELEKLQYDITRDCRALKRVR